MTIDSYPKIYFPYFKKKELSWEFMVSSCNFADANFQFFMLCK